MNEICYHVEACYKSLNKYKEELCGDNVRLKREKEFFHMVLADGLGSGVKANILSNLTSTIISEMVSSGEELEDVIDTMIHTLPECKERGIAYSTFSIAQVFNYGLVYLAEFDNPKAIVLRDRQILDLNYINRKIIDKEVNEAVFKAHENDVILLFSDGLIHAGLGQSLNFGWDHKAIEDFVISTFRPNDKVEDMVDILLANVNYLYGGKCGDDSTVAIMKVVKAKNTIVMVGPPKNKEDDALVVNKLMKASGKKVCCGGTTSNIVARVLGKEVSMNVDMSTLSVDVPPTVHIEGIDLATEGVLTLQKVVSYLRKMVDDPKLLKDVLSSKDHDGALDLLRVLINDSTMITFMVGQSDNPAHKALAYSTISLNAKKQIIEEIASYLRKLNKIVEVEYY